MFAGICSRFDLSQPLNPNGKSDKDRRPGKNDTKDNWLIHINVDNGRDGIG